MNFYDLFFFFLDLCWESLQGTSYFVSAKGDVRNKKKSKDVNPEVR